MSQRGRSRLVVMLSVGLFAGTVLAQVPADNYRNATVGSGDLSATDSDNTTSDAAEEPQPQYAAALDGTGLISLSSRIPSHFLWGATVAGGWDSNPANLGNGVASGMYTLNPYVGAQISTPKTQSLFQYQSTNTGFTSNYARQSMNVASARILGNLNERLSLDLKAMGSYGQDSIRFLGSQQTVAVGEVAGIGPGSASYLPNAGTVTYAVQSIGAVYRKSERDTVELSFSNSFNHYSSLGESNSVATFNLAYARDLSPTLAALAYGQGSAYYGSLRCKSYGSGAGLRWQASERTAVALSGGPQLNTSECGTQQGFAYNASFSTQLTGKSHLYLLSARQPTASYLGPGLWQDSASAGYQRQVTAIGTISLDIGYVASKTLTTVNSYRGTYVDFIYGYHLSHGLRASYSYRGYFGNYGGTGLSRNVAMFSMVWTSEVNHDVR
ncbi:MAG: hypothetical protein J0G35_13615 [Acidobacteriales bacterium]|nr:hypothetical protein [Terriglobales bacterium]